MLLIIIIFQLLLLFFAITVHEFAHGWVAYKLGDPTAKYSGRLSLNPLVHIDPVGTIMLPLMMILLKMPPIGWAKPVPVNFLSLKNPKRDMLWVGIAGPCANFLLAILLALVFNLLGLKQNSIFALIFRAGILINLILGIFNLIPIPPLDGSRIASSLLPWKYANAYNRIEPFGFIIIIALVYLGVIRSIILPAVVRVAAFLGQDFSYFLR